MEIKTKNRTAYIDGYVEDINGDPFAKSQRVQVSIICPEPYFLGAEENKAVTYPSTNIVTLSDTSHGAVFAITAGAAVTGVTIGNTETGGEFKVNTDLASGDIVTLDTRQGKKSLKLNHNGTITNILQYMDSAKHDWLQLIPYANNYITLSSASLSAVVTYRTHYEGV